MCSRLITKGIRAIRLIYPDDPPSTVMSKIAPQVLASFESKSRPGSSHQVRRGADGVVYCTCPSWRFQHNSPSNRTCTHIEQWKAQTLVPGSSTRTLLDVLGPGPEAIRPVRRSRARKVAPAQVEVAARRDTIPSPPPAEFLSDEPNWETDTRPTAWSKILSA